MSIESLFLVHAVFPPSAVQILEVEATISYKLLEPREREPSQPNKDYSELSGLLVLSGLP